MRRDLRAALKSRQLTTSDVHAVIRDLREEYETHAEQYRRMRRHDAADRHRRLAAILGNYLST
ncbi:hypothetical protein B1R94_11350 [Mycolicibacterium litorale]|nr:hypothetical protein B1R94_11350 [Mycolicibacterium litorale]